MSLTTKKLSELYGAKRWDICGWEIEAKTLRGALLSEVRQCECLAWVLIEPDRDEEFEYQRQQSLHDDEELTDDEIWGRVCGGDEFLWSDTLSEIQHAQNDEAILGAVFLTWDNIKILATTCQASGCLEMLDVSEDACPECGAWRCYDHKAPEEDGCWECGYKQTSIDFLRRVLND